MSSSQQPVGKLSILSPRQLDRRRWGATIAFESYGARAVVRVDDPALVDEVVAHLPFGWRPAEPCGDEPLFSLVTHATAPDTQIETWYAVYGPDGMTIQTPELKGALEDLESRMQIHVAEMARDRIFLHAGVVVWRGQAILLPGRSYSGKTTLVRELVRAGAIYYSDEYAVLDAQGLVHPFARPLAIRVNGSRQEKQAVEALGGRTGTEPVPVGVIVLSQYQRRARWQPERLSQGQGLLELLNQAIPARRKPAAALKTLERVVALAPVVRIVRGEARAAVPRLMSLLEN
jgi:hypothetical protein